MALTFPAAPANGASHTQGGVNFIYNSTVGGWVGAGTGALALPAGTATGQTIHWNGSSWGAGIDSARNILAAQAGTPTLRDDGSTLVQGDIYTNTSLNKVMLWTGSAWVASSIALDDISDVNSTGATTGQVLSWNGASWVPTTVAGGGSTVASGITVTPTGTIAATDVQTALAELDTEKLAAVTTSILLSGTGVVTSPLTIAPLTAADDGKVLTIQADGSVAWEVAAAGGTLTLLTETSTTPTLSTRTYQLVAPGTWVTGNVMNTTAQKFTSTMVFTDPTVGLMSFTDLVGHYGYYAIKFASCTAMTSLSLPVFTKCNGGLSISSNTSLNTLNLPVLTSVVGSGEFGGTSSPAISIGSNPALTTLSFPALTTVTGSSNVIGITSNSALTTISFPALVTATGTFMSIIDVSSCPALSSFIFPTTLKLVKGDIKVIGAALSQASVDSILIRLAALDGTAGTTSYISSTVTLSGGTSSTPSAAGLTAKATLVARGCTVTHN